MKRTKLADRTLPRYTNGEESMNMVTHIVGGGFGILILLLCCLRSFRTESATAIIGSGIYGVSMITVYSISSIYHGLRKGTAKKVLQVIDHCMIYFLIAGTYTPILLVCFIPAVPFIGWGLMVMEWGLGILAATLTAIDLKRYQVFSMICYIFMGWGIAFFLPQAMVVMTRPGFYFLLAGGIAYTIGAVLFGLGKKLPWMHAVFHIFVILGSLFQYLAIILYLY